jgi:2'-5' RNA ligase
VDLGLLHMRLFVAIDLDDDARLGIAAEQKRLMRELAGRESSLQMVRAEQMHLTLAFLGEVDDVRSAALVAAMGEDVKAAPFAIVFAGLGVFPQRGAPRVLWLGVTRGHHDAMAVQRQIADRLTRVRIEPEQRAYHPHLTLARWRTSTPADRRRALAADRGAEIARVDAAAVTLYQSRLSPSGPSYTVLARAALQS